MAKTASQIGAEIKRLREARGMTQAELAAAIGVGVGAVSRWERGERSPMAAQYQRAMLALGDKPSGFSVSVPRGTSVGSLIPPDLVRHVEQFERRMLRLQASDREIDFILNVLESEAASKLITFDEDGEPLDHAGQVAELQRLFTALEHWLRLHVDAREGSSHRVTPEDRGEPTQSGAPRLPMRRVDSSARHEETDAADAKDSTKHRRNRG